MEVAQPSIALVKNLTIVSKLNENVTKDISLFTTSLIANSITTMLKIIPVTITQTVTLTPDTTDHSIKTSISSSLTIYGNCTNKTLFKTSIVNFTYTQTQSIDNYVTKSLMIPVIKVDTSTLTKSISFYYTITSLILPPVTTIPTSYVTSTQIQYKNNYITETSTHVISDILTVTSTMVSSLLNFETTTKTQNVYYTYTVSSPIYYTQTVNSIVPTTVYKTITKTSKIRVFGAPWDYF